MGMSVTVACLNAVGEGKANDVAGRGQFLRRRECAECRTMVKGLAVEREVCSLLQEKWKKRKMWVGW